MAVDDCTNPDYSQHVTFTIALTPAHEYRFYGLAGLLPVPTEAVCLYPPSAIFGKDAIPCLENGRYTVH